MFYLNLHYCCSYNFSYVDTSWRLCIPHRKSSPSPNCSIMYAFSFLFSSFSLLHVFMSNVSLFPLQTVCLSRNIQFHLTIYARTIICIYLSFVLSYRTEPTSANCFQCSTSSRPRTTSHHSKCTFPKHVIYLWIWYYMLLCWRASINIVYSHFPLQFGCTFLILSFNIGVCTC